MTNTLNTLLPFLFLVLHSMVGLWPTASRVNAAFLGEIITAHTEGLVSNSNYELIQYNCHTVGTTGICPKLHIEILLQCAENCIMYSLPYSLTLFYSISRLLISLAQCQSANLTVLAMLQSKWQLH